MESAGSFESYLMQTFPLLLAGRNDLSLNDISKMAAPQATGSLYEQNDEGKVVAVDVEEDMSEEEVIDSQSQTFREIIAMVLPYLNIMLLYFLVLFYGQTTAQSVLLEKTSKLMDTFLLSVKPEAMVMGKVFAAVLACLIQVSCWFAGLLAGLFAGTKLIEALNPDSTMIVLRVLRNAGLFSEIFTPVNILFFLLYVAAGTLIYLSLSAIGGAIAGKQEDLNNTNILFTLVLVVSFFATIANFTSGIDRASAGATVLDFIPFTSILVTPGHIMSGTVTPLLACISLFIALVTALLIMMLAGRAYRMFALYKGNVPKPGEIIKVLIGK